METYASEMQKKDLEIENLKEELEISRGNELTDEDVEQAYEIKAMFEEQEVKIDEQSAKIKSLEEALQQSAEKVNEQEGKIKSLEETLQQSVGKEKEQQAKINSLEETLQASMETEKTLADLKIENAELKAMTGFTDKKEREVADQPGRFDYIFTGVPAKNPTAPSVPFVLEEESKRAKITASTDLTFESRPRTAPPAPASASASASRQASKPGSPYDFLFGLGAWPGHRAL
jgi:DNA repair exonuclease SbcCD ATPase subunit